LEPPIPFMRARTPRACGKAGVSLSAAGAACAGLRLSGSPSRPRPSGAALSAACAEVLRSTGQRHAAFGAPRRRPRVGQVSLRRQGERAGRGRPTFSARVEAGRGGARRRGGRNVGLRVVQVVSAVVMAQARNDNHGLPSRSAASPQAKTTEWFNRPPGPTPRPADPRSALEKRAGLARKRSGQRPGLPRPARAADAHVSRSL
jgi:hypothetical protein